MSEHKKTISGNSSNQLKFEGLISSFKDVAREYSKIMVFKDFKKKRKSGAFRKLAGKKGINDRLLGFLDDFIRIYFKSDYMIFKENFWDKLDVKEKGIFVALLFNYLINCPSEHKILILEVLENLFLDLNSDAYMGKGDGDNVTDGSEGSGAISLREQIFSIFYAALFEKHNYKLALEALKFFSSLWQHTDTEDPIRSEIFPKLLDFMDNDDPLLAEEGIFEVFNLLEDSTNAQKKEYFERLLEMAVDKKYRDKVDVQYAIFSCMKDLLLLYLGAINAYPPDRIKEVFKFLIENVFLSHPKPVIEFVKMILEEKVELDENSERKIIDMLKKAGKNLSYEYRAEFWEIIKQLLENPTKISKKEIIRPFLGDLQELFRDRESISPEVRIFIEQIVSFLWGAEILEPSELEKFYG